MSIKLKQLLDDKEKSSTIQIDNYFLKLNTCKRISKSPAYQTLTPYSKKPGQLKNNLADLKLNPIRISKSSIKRSVNKLDKGNSTNNELHVSLPQINMCTNNKPFAKEKSNNEMLSASNANRANQFKNSIFYINKQQLMQKKQSFDKQTEVKLQLNINNYKIIPVQLFKAKKEYASTLLKYSCQTKPGTHANGYIKTNQDSYLAKHNVFGLNNYSLFGVFDGHGSNGHLVSRFIRDFFSIYYTKAETFNQLMTIQSSSLKEKEIHAVLTKEFLLQSCMNAENKLNKLKSDASFSGCTGVIVIHIEDKLYCLNTGDSRAIYIDDEGNTIQISRDHKPDLFDEEKRIINSGGRIDRAPGSMNYGPFRVWVKHEDYPGLAMSRSYGDSIAKGIGVICEPGK